MSTIRDHSVYIIFFLLFSHQVNCQNEGLDNVNQQQEDQDFEETFGQFIQLLSDEDFLTQLIQGLQGVASSNQTDQTMELAQTDLSETQVMKMLMPILNMSNTCEKDIYTMVNDSSAGKEYAQRMLTAAGSPPSAAAEFTWNLASFGLYQQCVAVKKGSYDGAPFDAKYCQLGFPVEEAKASIGQCVPHSCSSIELTALTYRIAAVVSPLPKGAYVYFLCEEEVGWDADAIVTLFLCCAFLLCVVMATAYDIISLHKEQKSKEDGNVRIQMEGGEATSEETSALNDDSKVKEEVNGGENEVAVVEENNEEKPTERRKKKGLDIEDLVRAFSLVHNAPKIFNTEIRPGSFPALNGIRVLSMFWIILGHTLQFEGFRLDNIGYVLTTILPKFYFVMVWNATYAVDTFFLLSGLLLCYLTLKALKKCDGKLNWGLFYFHRWWRITPVYIMALAIWSSLLIHLADGPSANATFNGARQLCRDNWWANLLYINNLYPFPGNVAKMCMGWSWYLAVDMQFFIITPPLLILLFKRPRLGIAAIAVVCVASFITTASLAGYWGLKAGLNSGFYNNRSLEDTGADRIYAKPYTRISTYLVGILTGYVMFAYESHRPKIPKWGLAVGWSVSIILAMIVIFGLWKTENEKQLSQGAAIMYHTFSRFSFALAVAWVVLVCVFDYGGPVNTFLSWGIWVPLARLTFSAYLLHPVLLFLYIFPSKVLFHYWGFQAFYTFIATIVLSYAAAFVLSVLVEAPTMGLEKMFFRKKTK